MLLPSLMTVFCFSSCFGFMPGLANIITPLSIAQEVPGNGEELSDTIRNQQDIQQDANPWTFSGWADAIWFDTDRLGDNPVIDVANLYILTAYQFNSKWKALVEVALEKEISRSSVDSSRELVLERAYIEYKWKPEFKFRLGQFYTPMGIYKQRHWSYTMDTIQKPIIEENQYIPANALGIELFGSMFTRKGNLNYTLLFSDGNRDYTSNRQVDDEFGFGGDLNYNYNDRILFGASYYRYRNEDDVSYYLDAMQIYMEGKLCQNQLMWRGEWLFLQRAGHPETDGFYAQIKWNFTHSFYLNARLERADNKLLVEGTRHDAQIFTAGFKLNQPWKIKLEFATNSFEEKSFKGFKQMALWVGYAF